MLYKLINYGLIIFGTIVIISGLCYFSDVIENRIKKKKKYVKNKLIDIMTMYILSN